MIGFIEPLFYTVNYNQLQQLTINDCLRLDQSLTGLRVFLFCVTDLVLIY
jgi:hypothetical protein